MRTYLDTSILVAAHTRELHTAGAQAWLAAQSGGDLMLSSWTLLECESALAIKLRRGEIDSAGQAAAIADIDAFAACFAPVVQPGEHDYRGARKLCRDSASRLRAGDSLHLAIALHLAVSHFATLDQILAENAVRHGLVVIPQLGGG